MSAGTQAQVPRRAAVRELAHRVGSGIEVSLLWRRRDGTITLKIVEIATGVELELGVPPEEALEAFYHPYAYLPRHTEEDVWQEPLAA